MTNIKAIIVDEERLVDRIENKSNTFHRAFLKNIPEPLEVSFRYAKTLKSLN